MYAFRAARGAGFFYGQLKPWGPAWCPGKREAALDALRVADGACRGPAGCFLEYCGNGLEVPGPDLEIGWVLLNIEFGD